MMIRRATIDDHHGIVDLIGRYQHDRLSPEERKGGFLSAEFTLQQVVEAAGDLGVFVAREAGEVVGAVFAFRHDAGNHPPIVREMLRTAEKSLFRQQPLGARRYFVYGPVCIAREHRGRGLLRSLLSRVLDELSGRYEAGVTLVANENAHSLRAHTAGLGMEQVAEFDFNGRRHSVLAFEARGGPL
jgi:predicted N-acetyltransferase YhbS